MKYNNSINTEYTVDLIRTILKVCTSRIKTIARSTGKQNHILERFSTKPAKHYYNLELKIILELEEASQTVLTVIQKFTKRQELLLTFRKVKLTNQN